MGVTLTADDLAPFAEIDPDRAAAMIEDVLAFAVSVAPCLSDPELEDWKAGAAKAILRGAVLRWHESDSGAIQTQQAGPFSQTIDATVRRSGLLWPSEIQHLQDLCKSEQDEAAAYHVDTVGDHRIVHADICSLRFDPDRGCSCGALIAGKALYEWGW